MAMKNIGPDFIVKWITWFNADENYNIKLVLNYVKS